MHSGKVRYVGCCNHEAWQVCKALWVADRLNAIPYMCVQNMYSLLNRHLEKEMFPFLRDAGLGAMAYSPLHIGLLSGLYTPGAPPPPGSLWASRPAEAYAAMAGEAQQKVMATVIELAGELGKTPAQLAIALGAVAPGDHAGHHRQRHGRTSRRQPRRRRLDARRSGARET